MRPVDDSRVGETVSSVPNSAVPSETRSPRSPRSPFRFGQKKPESAGGLQSLQLTDVLQQQHHQDQLQQRGDQHQHQHQRQAAQRQYHTQSQTHATPQTQHQYQIQQQSPHTPLDEPYYPGLPSPPPHQFDQSQRAQLPPTQQQQPLGHRHTRHDEDKASKSGFFFPFGKSSKSSDRLNNPSHADSPSRGETMSRDSDHPPLSKQSSKQSGTHNLLLRNMSAGPRNGPSAFPCSSLTLANTSLSRNQRRRPIQTIPRTNQFPVSLPSPNCR